MAVICPLQGPPIVETLEKAGPFEWLTWGINLDTDSVINKPFEEKEVVAIMR
jgi:hypothetical protein